MSLPSDGEELPFSPAAERNSAPIAAVLADILMPRDWVLEIGSGTGQHAVFFSNLFRKLEWQASDRAEMLPTLSAYLKKYAQRPLPDPIELDLLSCTELPLSPSVIFTANTLHIMPEAGMDALASLSAQALPVGGRLVVYGPFRLRNQPLEPSNEAFDRHLRERADHMGLRYLEDFLSLALAYGLHLSQHHLMPANNRLLCLERR